MIDTLANKQFDLKQREEVRTVSETTKQTWAQMYEAEANARALRQGELKGELNERRELLITLLGDAFGELPEPLTSSIRACEDPDRLKTAIRKLRTLTALEQFQPGSAFRGLSCGHRPPPR